ncbi:MAG: outer membrane lipoprotein carrier protein LolA [Bacilli bacterium]|nr:outer membrane lipoprotein carrier protein LolA [Bacilli bacterium]
MKKLIICLGVFILFITGCGKYSDKDIVKEIEKKTKNSYILEGDLAISNNDDLYNYEVEVSYKKDHYYKVSLTNMANGHSQIILKNDDGVYILTPALNKSFKFQSDWPYDNSQIYLIKALLNDINNDEEVKFSENDDNYTFITKVNYPNNKMLVNQKITIDKKLNIKNVKVYDSNDSVKMELNVDRIDYSPTFKDDYFELETIMRTFDDNEVVESSNLDDSIYPLFVPVNTSLTNSERVETDNGERIIMTFSGDKPFLLVEETANVMEEFTVIPTYGEPYMLMDTLGVVTDNSLSWTSGGIEYYLVSDVMGKDELIEIAQSISAIPTMK